MNKFNQKENLIYPSNDNNHCSYNKTLDYQSLYDKSIENPEQFWLEVAQQLFWKCPPKIVLDGNFDIRKGKIFVNFMKGALTNACYNVLDRNIDDGLGDNIAYYWEGNDGVANRRITYTELRREVCKFANALKVLGIKKGDRIAIYMPNSIECIVAMLACARIGAVHSVVFAGFSPESLASRIIDARSVLLISSDGCYRAKKMIPLKNMADFALDICRQSGYQKISNIVFKHSKTSSLKDQYDYPWNDEVDICWDEITKNQSYVCEPVWVDAEDTLFVIYTSGSTGKPKGIVHSTGGFLVHSYYTLRYLFDIKAGDVFFSTTDMGWVTSHLNIVYGCLSIGATIVLMEGTVTFPKPDRIWEIIDKFQVNVLHTVPTVLRILHKLGDNYVTKHKRNSLRIMSITGEPINNETWLWLWKVVGNKTCSIVDIYGQTETGVTFGILHSSILLKPGSSIPLPGVVPVVLNENGIEIIGPGNGNLAFKMVWPCMARTIVGNNDLFESTYFKKYPGFYWTGDECTRNANGYYSVKGRVDDTINVSGHLLSNIEIENSISEVGAIAEVAVVSIPDSMKGEVPFAYVVLNDGFEFTAELEKDIKNTVRMKIGALAQPDIVLAISVLPKSKSGKIMRRFLNKINRNETDFGDTSILEDESVIQDIAEKFSKIKKTFYIEE